MELPDHPPGCLYGPPSRLRAVNVGGNFRRRGSGTAVQPLGLSAVTDDGVPHGLQALQVGGRLQLPPQNPLAEVMPLRKEPGPVVEALNLYAPEAVDRGFEGGMRRHIELGVRGAPAEVAPAMNEIRAGIQALGGRIDA